MRRTGRALAAGLLGPAVMAAALAETLTATPENYREQLRRLGPGVELVLAPGVYREGLSLHGVSGLPGLPVVIRGAGEETVFLGRNGRNTVSLRNTAYVRISDLTLEGRQRNADAVKAEGTADWVHHITLERLVIRGHDGHQQHVGISTKAPAWDWTIRDVVIDGAGTGMYFGDSDGSAPFIGGLIEGSTIRNTTGYALQIKQQGPRSLVPGMPLSPRVTTIRDNVFDKSHGGATGGRARPSVLLGHQPLEGPGRDDRILVYRNLFYENPTEALLQAEGRVAVYSNVFMNTAGVGRGVMIMRHRAPPRSIEIFHNTVLASDIGIAVWNAEPGSRRWVAANAVFADTPITGDTERAWNHLAPLRAAAQTLRSVAGPLEAVDVTPVAGRLERAGVPAGPLVGYPDAGRDFHGTEWISGVPGAVLPQ